MNIFIYLFVWCAIFNGNHSFIPERNDHDDPEKVLNSNFHKRNEIEHYDPIRWHDGRRVPNTFPPVHGGIPNKGVNDHSAVPNEHHHDRGRIPTEGVNNPSAVNTKTIGDNHNKTKRIENVSSTPSAMKHFADPDVIHLPYYGVVLIALAMSLMFLIIMALLIMLYKIKKNNRHRDSMNVAIQPKSDTNFKYARQLSGEASKGSTLVQDKATDKFNLQITRSDSKALFFNNLDTVDASKEKSPVDDITTSRLTIPESNPCTAKGRPPTLTRILKQPVNNYVPISPEKMSELCRGVLDRSKTKKSDDTISLSDKILSDSKQEEKDNFDLEKSLSTPELDIDMYDVLPSPSQQKFFNNSVDIKNEICDEIYDNPPNHSIQKKLSLQNKDTKEVDDNESDDGIYDNPVPNKHDNEVFDDGIYDNPPPNHNRKRNVVVPADDEEYVMPLTSDYGLYGNAKSF